MAEDAPAEPRPDERPSPPGEEPVATDAALEDLPLAEVPLPALYGDPALYDLMAQMTAPKDLAFYEGWVDAHEGPVLELGCGTGRLTIPLAARVETWGLDLVEAMVMTVKVKAEAAGVRLALAHGDMRHFELEQRFATVIMPYNTFNHLMGLGDILRSLACVRRHLAPGGRLLIDTFHPDPRRLHVGGGDEEKLFRYRDPTSHAIVQFFEQSHYDPIAQVNRARWRWADEDGTTLREDEVRMRLFFPAELEAVLRLGGFDLEARWGSYEREPFDERSSKQLCVCRPR